MSKYSLGVTANLGEVNDKIKRLKTEIETFVESFDRVHEAYQALPPQLRKIITINCELDINCKDERIRALLLESAND